MWQAKETLSISVFTPPLHTLSSTVAIRHPVSQVKALPGSKMRITLPEIAQEANQLIFIIILMGHQMPAPHVQPFDLRKEMSETLFHSLQRTPQIFRTRLAQRMKMQTFHPLRQLLQTRNRNPQTGSRTGRIIQIRLNSRILRINPQSTRYAGTPCPLAKTVILAEGIERNMAAIPQNLIDFLRRIDRSIRMCRATVFLKNETCLCQRTGSGTV